MSKKDIIKELREDRAKRIEELKGTIANHNPEALFADGFDNAILGYSTDLRVIYSVDQIMETLVERDGMTLGENIKDVSLDFSNDDSLELRINEYLENFKEISSKTLKYFDNNHNLENTSSELLKKIDKSTSQWGKIKKSKFTSRGIVYNFYKYLKR